MRPDDPALTNHPRRALTEPHLDRADVCHPQPTDRVRTLIELSHFVILLD
jgi:hypothetical protein